MSNNNIVVVVSPSCVAVKFVFQNINSANFANYSDNSVHVTINKYDVMYNILYNKHRWGGTQGKSLYCQLCNDNWRDGLVVFVFVEHSL